MKNPPEVVSGRSDKLGSMLQLRGFGWRALGPTAIIAASLLVALTVYFGFLGSSLVETVAEWTAQWTSTTLNLFGASTRVNGTILSSNSFAVNIVAECTAVGPLVLFIGAVLAYPARLKTKGIGILLGLIVLTGINVVRIVSLFWIGSNYPEYLDIAHLLVWQAAIIIIAIIMWLFWVEKMAGVRHS